jgi:hypothetical protein
MDSTDYGSPLLSADPENASPLDFEGAKRHQLKLANAFENLSKNHHFSYSNYLSGRAQEVAKRRNLIERLEKARDKGVLFCTIPQVSKQRLYSSTKITNRILGIFLFKLQICPDCFCSTSRNNTRKK